MSFRASLQLCTALAALMLPLFPGCLNPRPEEDPQVVDVTGETGGPGGGGGGSGVFDPGGNIDLPAPDDTEGASPSPPSRELDAGVPDGGVPDGGGCEPRSDAEDAPDAGPAGDDAPPG